MTKRKVDDGPTLGRPPNKISALVEPHVNLEGVRMDDPMTLLRSEKCARVLAALEAYKAVLLRAPPMSGKTALGQVLEKAGREAGYQVFFFSLLVWDPKKEDAFESAFERVHGISLDTLWNSEKTLIIFDETQMLYRGQESFWAQVKRGMQLENCSRFAFLAAYGESPTQNRSHTHYSATPIAFTKTFSASFMALTEMEMEEFRRSFNATKWGATSPLSPDIAKAIYCRNGGHAGLTARTCYAIGEKFYNHSRRKTNDKSIMGFLLSWDMLSILNSTRALTGGQCTASPLTEDENEYLKSVIHARGLKKPKIVDDSPESRTSLQLIAKGILGTIDESYVGFVSPLACSIYINRLYGKSSSAVFSTLSELLLQALPRMDKAILQNSLSRGEDNMLYERQFQVEFYRCVMEILGKNHGYCSPDVGRMFGSEGFLDFYVDTDKQWGVELVRNNNRLEEHINRFVDGEIYCNIPFSEFVVLNFVWKSNMKTNYRASPKFPSEWRVSYNETEDFFMIGRYVDGKPKVENLSFLSSVQSAL